MPVLRCSGLVYDNKFNNIHFANNSANVMLFLTRTLIIFIHPRNTETTVVNLKSETSSLRVLAPDENFLNLYFISRNF